MTYLPLNSVVTSDGYTDQNTLLCAGAARINFDVTGQAIYYQLGDGIGGIHWRDEVQLGPGFRSLDRLADAVRVRSFTPGSPATVTVEAIPPDEIPHGTG